jgi:hypothetical protein
MTEGVRALLLDGHLVDVGDLVLHGAGMDVHHLTHEFTRSVGSGAPRWLARRPGH